MPSPRIIVAILIVIAAVGLVQLGRVRTYVDSAIANARIYTEAVKDVPWIRVQHVPENREHTYHIWAATFEGEQYGISLKRFKQAVAENGVGINVGYIQTAPYLHDV